MRSLKWQRGRPILKRASKSQLMREKSFGCMVLASTASSRVLTINHRVTTVLLLDRKAVRSSAQLSAFYYFCVTQTGMHVYPTFLANNAAILFALTSMIIALKYLTALLVRCWKEQGRKSTFHYSALHFIVRLSFPALTAISYYTALRDKSLSRKNCFNYYYQLLFYLLLYICQSEKGWLPLPLLSRLIISPCAAKPPL